ncbi:MAG: LamG domain-containing protein, partial [Candidatus Pacebacteria bacterium]|nr:LamG domain-containing protein [Candidatus Paceibacterota bacterium]
TTATDKSGNGNTGTLGAATTPGADDPKWASVVQPFSGGRAGGGALSFDGVNDYVDAGSGSSLNITGDISISFWMKTSGTGIYGTVGRYSVDATPTGYSLFLNRTTAGKFDFYKSNGLVWATNLNSKLVNDGIWHYITLTGTDAFGILYIDGISNGTFTYTNPISSPTTNVFIGSHKGTAYYFNGLIDDVRIYNRALSEAEIRYQYNQTKPIAQWKFDEGADTATTCNATISSVYDYSGNGNTGTLYNPNVSPATSSMWSDGKYGCALSFDGVDDYVDAGVVPALQITTTMSISLWAKWNGVATYTFEIGNQVTWNTNGYMTYYSNYNGGTIDIISFNPITYRRYTIPRDTQWHHYTMVWGSSDFYVYQDGILKSGVLSGTYHVPTLSNENFMIGRRDTANSGYTGGLIDDVRIYNYARTADQIRADYNAGSALHLGQ